MKLDDLKKFDGVRAQRAIEMFMDAAKLQLITELLMRPEFLTKEGELFLIDYGNTLRTPDRKASNE